MYVSFKNYKGGINNLIVVSNDNGIYATSLKDIKTALRNYERKLKRCSDK